MSAFRRHLVTVTVTALVRLSCCVALRCVMVCYGVVFSVCYSVVSQARVTDAVQFGDGFGLAGAVIMHLLGQRHQFELLDFSYHVLNVNNFER